MTWRDEVRAWLRTPEGRAAPDAEVARRIARLTMTCRPRAAAWGRCLRAEVAQEDPGTGGEDEDADGAT